MPYLRQMILTSLIYPLLILCTNLIALILQQQCIPHAFVDLFPSLSKPILFHLARWLPKLQLLQQQFFHYITLQSKKQNAHQPLLSSPIPSFPKSIYHPILKQKQMKLTHAYYNNEKLTQVINLSSNYKKHRENIATIKPVVDFTDQKHMKKALKLSTEKDHYTHNVRNLKLTQLKKENNEILRRIVGVKSSLKKELSPPRSPGKKDNRSLERSPSRQSVTSVSSEKSCASNFRRRTLRMQQIDRENKKIAARILHPKMVKEMNYLKLQQSYSRIRSRFSQRSQSIMQSLALDSLKLDKKNVQFLPQLSFKRLDRTVQHQNKTARPSPSKNSNPKANTTQTQRTIE